MALVAETQGLPTTAVDTNPYTQPRETSPDRLKFKCKLPLDQLLQTILFSATLRQSTHKQLVAKARCWGKHDVKELTNSRSLKYVGDFKNEHFSVEPSKLNSPDRSIWNRVRVATAAGEFTCAAVFRRGIYLTNFHFTKSKKKAFKHCIIKT